MTTLTPLPRQHGIRMSVLTVNRWQTLYMRKWTVGGGVIFDADRILMVQNHRRGGRTHWSTPGGVIYESEKDIQGQTREIKKKTRCFHVFACKMLKCRYDFFRKILKMIDFHRENQQGVKLFLHTPLVGVLLKLILSILIFIMMLQYYTSSINSPQNINSY